MFNNSIGAVRSESVRHMLTLDPEYGEKPETTALAESVAPAPALPIEIWLQIAGLVGPNLMCLGLVDRLTKEAADLAATVLTVSGRDGLAAIKGEARFSGIKELTLRGDFNDTDLEGLPEKLSALKLRKCVSITPVGLKHLHKIGLHSLDVAENAIGDLGAQVLSQHPKLKSLSMRDCRLTFRGASEFISNRTLTSLDLSLNVRWSDESLPIAAIRHALLSHATIKDLNLRYPMCWINDDE
jgi:hypothetical protein